MNDELSDDETISIKKAISFSTREEQLDYIDRKLYRYHLFSNIMNCKLKECIQCDAFNDLVTSQIDYQKKETQQESKQ